MTGKSTKTAPVRDTYRHGDLRRALLEAGVQLAREGGPEAVVLREATRRVGVAPNAAYRHFANREALLEAVRSHALSGVAQAMEKELAGVRRSRRAADRARDGLRAIGTGYLRFALEETGLFRMGFASPDVAELNADPARAGRSGLNPFELLGAALDQLVAAGVLPLERRPNAEFLAWSSVHGMAMLMIDGPLRGLPRQAADVMGQRLLDMVERGI
ncbi:TetR/AcrR family transcriptional regulator [Variovorax sp. J22R133]|uniref:TetR/AcrR family transcriptional regulator n=1 Tax=Variovorax brevis TaxID=3053503 RepID=UPI0025783CC2|nr:TetR/AcrR family transcriptional regulator [Variovorax sp. J22R133]MDM0114602.1 TetR/AcrR family transcriptional regulator [Variovorax sp. J22R133]